MSINYLYQPGSTPLDSNGNGTILLKPDVGSYWLPTLVHISTRSTIPARCDLHEGSIAALNDPTTIKDFTFQANDTSTILSGTVVWPGEGVACVFTGGAPNDVAFCEVIGINSTTPPPDEIVPDVPGARFSGGFGPVANSVVLSDVNRVITHTNSASLPFATFKGQTVSIDMRSFQSFSLGVEAFGVPNNASGFNAIAVDLAWTELPTLALGPATADNPKHILSEQYYPYIAADKAGTFGTYGRLSITDSVRGPFLLVTLFNNAGADSVNFSTVLATSGRSVGGRYVQNTNPAPAFMPALPLGQLADTPDSYLRLQFLNILAGNSASALIPMMPGQASLWLQTTTAKFTYLFQDTNLVPLFEIDLAANVQDPTRVLNMPYSALILKVTNTDVATGTADFRMMLDRKPL